MFSENGAQNLLSYTSILIKNKINLKGSKCFGKNWIKRINREFGDNFVRYVLQIIGIVRNTIWLSFLRIKVNFVLLILFVNFLALRRSYHKTNVLTDYLPTLLIKNCMHTIWS